MACELAYLFPQVEVVYVGTIHAKHTEAVLMMLEAGKHILCEKPLTCSAEETRVLIMAAKEKGVFFMEVRERDCEWETKYD